MQHLREKKKRKINIFLMEGQEKVNENNLMLKTHFRGLLDEKNGGNPDGFFSRRDR